MARAFPLHRSILGAFALTTLLAGPVLAQEYPVQNGTLNVSDYNNDGRVGDNEPITISGGGFAPGSEVQITVGTQPIILGTTIADAAGEISTTVVLPASISDGVLTINATGANASGGVLVLGVQVTKATQTVEPSTTSTTRATTATTQNNNTTATTRATNTAGAGNNSNDNQLAFTGAETSTLLAGGLALVGAGGVLVLYRKRSLPEA